MFGRLNNNDNPYKVADFLEYECIKTGTEISSLSYRSYVSMSDDELINNGVESSDDKSVEVLDAAIAECSNRLDRCPNQYPFNIGNSSLNLKSDSSWRKDIYVFLLLTTRLNMKYERVQANLDGTELFEDLCALVTKEYYGKHCRAEVFGTSVKGSFKDKVEKLLRSLCIKGHFQEPEGSTGQQKDGNLDIVAWIPFSDKKDGQLIALGQCKTGTHWDAFLSELNAEGFFRLYSSRQPYSKPVRMFFVSESIGDSKWGERCDTAGVLFDRTRIMEFLPENMDEELLGRIKTWNRAAIVKHDQ